MTAEKSIGLSLLLATPVGLAVFIVWLSRARVRNIPLILAVMPLFTLSIAAVIVCSSVMLDTGLTWDDVLDFFGRGSGEPAVRGTARSPG